MQEYQIEQHIRIDLQSNEDAPVVMAKQFDHNMRVAAVEVWDGGRSYALSQGYVARVGVRKSDGKRVLNDCEAAAGGDTLIVYAVITQQMTAVKGEQRAEIQISGPDGQLRSGSFVLQVAPAEVGEDVIESLDEYKSIDALLAEVRQLKAAADQDAKAAAASATSAASSAAAAKASETAAATSQTAAANSAAAAKASETAAAGSKTAAKASEDNALASKTAAAGSASAAAGSATAAKSSETAAAQSATAAAGSATAAKASETNTAANKDAAAGSAAAAKISEDNAAASKTAAAGSAAAAKSSETAAAASKTAAASSATAAKTSETAAAASSTAAAASAQEVEDIIMGGPVPKTGNPILLALGQNRIESVAVEGKTTQNGDGPPSPTNIRELVPIGCQANLIKPTRIFNNVTIGGVTANTNPDGSVSLSGTSTSDFTDFYISGSYANITPIFALRAGTYTLSGIKSGVIVYLLSSEPVGISAYGDKTFYVDIDLPITGVLMRVLNGATVNTVISLMLNSGSISAPYVPYTGAAYGTQIAVNDKCTLLPLTEPLWDKDTAESGILSNFDCKLVLDGSEDEAWIYGSYINGMRAFIDLSTASYKKYTVASDYIPQGDVLENRFVCCFNSDKLSRFQVIATTEYFNSLGIASTAEWKSYLAAHPLTIWYKSASGGQSKRISQEKHIYKQLILDGTESNLRYDITSSSLYVTGVKTSGTSGNLTDVLLSSHFLSAAAGDNIIFSQPQNSRLVIQSSQWSSLDTAKTYFTVQHAAGTPVTVVYELAEAEIYAHDPVPISNPAGQVTISGENAFTVNFVAIGDMLKSVFDPQNKQKPYIPADEALSLAAYGGSAGGVVAKADEAAACTGNAATATKLQTVRKIGNASFDGSADITLAQIGVPNPNLLDNSDFSNPVNQRGLTTYPELYNQYSIDRWYANGTVAVGSNISISGTAITVERGGTLFATKLDSIGFDYNGYYSLSLKINGKIVIIENFQVYKRPPGVLWANIPPIATIEEDIRFLFYEFEEDPNTPIYFSINSLMGTSFNVDWVKLEKGSIATPYVPKGYGPELVVCRQYFRRYSGTGAMIGGTVGNGGTQIYIMVDVTGMRLTTPTVSASDRSTFTVYYINPAGASGSVVPSAPIAAYAYAGGQAMIPVSLSPNTTSAANFYILRTGVGGYLDISADL